MVLRVADLVAPGYFDRLRFVWRGKIEVEGGRDCRTAIAFCGVPVCVLVNVAGGVERHGRFERVPSEPMRGKAHCDSCWPTAVNEDERRPSTRRNLHPGADHPRAPIASEPLWTEVENPREPRQRQGDGDGSARRIVPETLVLGNSANEPHRRDSR